jgi:hypothetical protein
MNGSLVRLSLRRTRHYRTDRLLLHFYTPNAMMPRQQSTVALLTILRQSWKPLPWLMSRWSKTLDINVYPHIVFICSSVLRHKQTNLLLLILRPKPRKYRSDFKVQSIKLFPPVLRSKPGNPCFLSSSCVRCGSHMVSSDLSIVLSLSTRLVSDHLWSSAPNLLLLPRSWSMPALSHSPPTHHETSKNISPHLITQSGLVQPTPVESKFKLEQINY